jgi:hypothetical protein
MTPFELEQLRVEARMKTKNKCSVDGCQRNSLAKGYCGAHYQRMRAGKLQLGRKIGDKRGRFNPRWNGGTISGPDGRIMVFSPNHPHPNRSGHYVFRYRLMVEKHLGRYLLPSEIVRHKNGNPTDDRIDNLEVMDRRKHAKLHAPEMLAAAIPMVLRGERHPHAKLKASDIPKIRKMRAGGMTLSAIGRHFDVNLSNIHKVLMGQTWRDQ